MNQYFFDDAVPLPPAFYRRPDVVQIAKDLLGKMLVTNINGEVCAAKIVETEAYCGATDRACHAHFNKRTKRTEIMFAPGGVAYVYLCYGIHSLFNVVTNEAGFADAVLIRAAEPIYNVELMMRRRNISRPDDYRLTAGPGALSQAMGICTAHYGESLQGNRIRIVDYQHVAEKNILAGPRVGVAYAGKDALLPWRFRIAGNAWCSRAKQ